MSKYLLRRVLIIIPVLAGISLVLFTILAMAPGDPFEELATNPNVPPEVRMNLRAQFGLDDPIAIRYVRWFTSMMKGDWGFSFVSRVNVDQLILQRLPTTILVIGSAQLLGLLIAIPVLAGISLVLFVILALAPGDPFEELATNPNVPPEVRANLRTQFGLDDPIPIRYARWFSSMLRGDWGFSFVSRIDVVALILQRLPTTLFVLGSAQLLGLLVALPIGIYSAMRPYSFFDQVTTTLAFVGFSLPTFFTGLLFILFFSIYLDWLPFIYRADVPGTGLAWMWATAKQAIMPVAVLGLAQGAAMTRFVRSAVLEVIRLDYINTARAKGLSERVTILKHVVRNALIPVVTIIALQIPGIFTGAVITEQIFRVPGIGALLISSILANDTPVIMAITFVFSCLVVLFNLFADLLYGWLDPRISLR